MVSLPKIDMKKVDASLERLLMSGSTSRAAVSSGPECSIKASLSLAVSSLAATFERAGDPTVERNDNAWSGETGTSLPRLEEASVLERMGTLGFFIIDVNGVKGTSELLSLAERVGATAGCAAADGEEARPGETGDASASRCDDSPS